MTLIAVVRIFAFLFSAGWQAKKSASTLRESASLAQRKLVWRSYVNWFLAELVNMMIDILA